MYDLAIIGGGPAGYSAAFEALNSKLNFILFEGKEIGGTCLNRGCVPTKYLTHVARLYSEASTVFEWSMPVNYSSVHSKMTGIIEKLRLGIIAELKDRIINGVGIIENSKNIYCNGKKYEAANILIATGAKSFKPLFPQAILSDDLLKITEKPDELHILGGGSIAVEFANIFSTLGTKVSIYIRGDRLLRAWDKEIAVGITQSLTRKSVKIHKNCDFRNIPHLNNGIFLSAIGQHSVLPIILEELVELDEDGFIITDNVGRTKTPNIYAAGDVVSNSPKLAHIAMEQGRNVVRHIQNREMTSTELVVKCLYLDQEVASVGTTEKDIENKCEIGKATMFSNARTLISTKERGFIKILAEKQTGIIIGAHAMCERASDLIGELALAIKQKLTYKQMLDVIRPHPSYCEAITDALRNLEKKYV